MSFTPQLVLPEEHLSHLTLLKFPGDKKRIARLSLYEKQAWYAAQAPQEMIDLASTSKLTTLHFKDEKEYLGYEKRFIASLDFRRFWYWHYIFPLKVKRVFYSFKFW